MSWPHDAPPPRSLPVAVSSPASQRGLPRPPRPPAAPRCSRRPKELLSHELGPGLPSSPDLQPLRTTWARVSKGAPPFPVLGCSASARPLCAAEVAAAEQFTPLLFPALGTWFPRTEQSFRTNKKASATCEMQQQMLPAPEAIGDVLIFDATHAARISRSGLDPPTQHKSRILILPPLIKGVCPSPRLHLGGEWRRSPGPPVALPRRLRELPVHPRHWKCRERRNLKTVQRSIKDPETPRHWHRKEGRPRMRWDQGTTIGDGESRKRDGNEAMT